MKRDKRRHRYVVGYAGEGQCVHGMGKTTSSQYIDPLTVNQAQRAVRGLCSDVDRCIYELVPVKTIKGRKSQ